ncbi:MAG: T9SS type A sorting domain-containing protein, partial [Candidatus Symbiothrix sp.]|nr:T9SS type A sorting domain-containing protein [Candidatus Symbiothrix sp.]
LLTFCCLSAKAQITWPEGQLLPSFPAPAATQDHIYLNSNTGEEMYLFSSLKGLINRVQPRIFSYEGDDHAEGAFTWLNSLGIGYNQTTPWAALTKYKSEISGIIIYDPNQIHTVNLATVMAKGLNALIVAPSLLNRLTAAPYNFQVLADLRGQFSSHLQVYQHIYDNYWNDTDKRLLISLSPQNHKGSLREYAVALGEAVIWLDPKKSNESTLLNKFLADMPAGANCMGWWPEEAPGVERTSYYGITTIASDFSTNLTFHSGLPRTITPHPMPAKPALENKIYVAFIISDGDNLQYVEHRMRRFWDDTNRGSVPIGWTISPAMVDAMPGALNYFHQSSTDNDNLISGPSGYGYTYPNYWLKSSSHVDSEALADFVAKTEEYNVAAGIRVITVWNTITNGIDDAVGISFAGNSPSLLGLTAQNTGGNLSIYGSNRDPNVNQLPGQPLSCNYCTGEQAMIDHIDRYSEGWTGNAPRFLIIQGNPWNSEINPTGFKNMQNRYTSGVHAGKYVFVRPDHIFQLIREYKNLTINPGSIDGDGEGLTGTYFNGSNFETKIASRIDPCINFDWGNNISPMENVNNDNFSIRWTGYVMPRYSGTYTFYLTCYRGGKLWINNELIIDKWTAITPDTYTGTIALTAGEKYDLKLEYFDSRGSANCKLEWASGFQSREIIPQSHLFQGQSVDIKDVNFVPEVKVYSSRSEKGIVHVEIGDYSGNEEMNIAVYDVCGKILLKQTGREAKYQLDLSRYSQGIYLISVCTANYSKTVRYILR